MQGPSRQPEGVITAQLFRNRRRSNSHEPISHTHILNILDSLKRRVRQEQQLHRRLSEADPDTDSEAEGGVEDRDEELVTIREELSHERAQREEWMESAERRVDDLTSEKEKTSEQLDERTQELDQARSEKDDLQGRLNSAEEKAEELQRSLRDAQTQLEDVKRQKQQSDGDVKELQAQLSLFQQQNEEAAALKIKNDEKIQGLEESKEISGQHMQRLITEHKNRHEDAQRELQELQGRFDTSTKENTSSRSRIAELMKDATEHDGRRRELVTQVEEHKKLLQDAQNDLDLHGKELSQLLKEHEASKAEAARTSKERDDLQSNHDDLIAKGESDARDFRAQLQHLKSEYEGKSKTLQDEHQQQIDSAQKEQETLQSRYDDLTAKNAEEGSALQDRIRKIQKDHEDTLAASTGQHAVQTATAKRSLEELQVKHDMLIEQLDEHTKQEAQRLQSLKDEHEQALKSLADEHEEGQSQDQQRYDEMKVQHDRELGKMQDIHRDEMEKLQNALTESQQRAEQSDSHLRKRLAEMQNRTTDLEKERQSLNDELETIKADHENSIQSSDTTTRELQQRAADAEATSQSRETELRNSIAEKDCRLADLSGEITHFQQQLKEQSAKLERKNTELAEAIRAHDQRVTELEAGWSSKAEEAARVHQADKQSAADEAAREHANLETRLGELQAASDARAAAAQQDSATELAKAREVLQSQVKSAQNSLKDTEQRMESSKSQNDTAIDQMLKDHEARLDEMRSGFEKAQEESKATFEAQLAAAEAASATKSAETELQRERTFQDSSSNHEAELISLRQTHEESTNDMLRKLSAMETRLDRTGSDHAQTLSEKEELEYRISQLKSSHEQALCRLEKEHEAALGAARTAADQQLEEKLQAQSQTHSSEFDRLQESLNNELQNLQIQLEEAADLRHTQMEAADSERERALGELNERLLATEETSSALQTRLEAELTSRAETERSLAQLNRQRLEDDKKATQSRDELLQQIAGLQIERDTYAKRSSLASAIPKPDSVEASLDDTDDVALLKSKLAAAELERDEALKSNGQPTGGASELARQNEFLANQLEAMIATRSTPATPVSSRQDAFAQTDPAPVTTEDQQIQQIPERAVLPRNEQANRRPVTPQSQHKANSRRTADRSWKTRSFEDYLQQAQAELSELGSVITQNEALFAQKIQEHVGDLQRAKDQLAAEYKDKFDGLLKERERMERDVSATSAEEFAKERRKLVAQYGADDDEPAKVAAAITNLSSPKKRALRSAEEKLVSQFNNRIVKRKSQIAMKHAEEFQSLTQDYDRRLAELLGNRDRLESDLSVEPNKFEKDLDDLEVMSAQLENERINSVPSSPQVEDAIASAVEDAQAVKVPHNKRASMINMGTSQLPKRSLTSIPRTPTSIPKAMPYAGRKTFTDPQQRIRQPVDGQRSATERLPHIQQQSVSRARNSSDQFPSKRFSSNPRPPQRQHSQPLNTTAAQDFGIEPSTFEQAAQQERSRVSPEMAKPNFSKRRSLRHSSGIMYSGWQVPRD
jgi:chromosome segregation ATPase